MRQWREERVQADEWSLHWMRSEQDADETPILFLHGVLRRWQTFTPLYMGLAHRWPVCGLDFPGHGFSDRSPRGYLVTDYIAAATALVQAHGPQEMVLYGHSLGAMVALGVAANLYNRGQIRAVVLEDPPFETMGARIAETPWLSYFAAVREIVQDARRPIPTLARELAGIVTTDPLTGKSTRLGDVRDAASLRFLAACLRDVDPAVLDPIVAGCWLAGYDWRPMVQSIGVPMLLLQADAAVGGMLIDDDARPWAAARDATLVKLAGAGHNLHTSRTQEVLNLVTQFLDSLP